MSNAWTDFNDADASVGFDIIPKGTVAPMRLHIRPGGLDDPSQGWTGGYATKSKSSDSVYLSCEAVITDGPYVKRKIFFNVGLFSPKGKEWGQMGRSFIKGLLNSAFGYPENDRSEAAMKSRRINGFADLDGLEFVGKVDIEKQTNGDLKNTIKIAVQPGDEGYMRPNTNNVPRATAPVTYNATAAAAPQYAAQAAANTHQAASRPAWAQ